jgi:hypothetical protein
MKGMSMFSFLQEVDVPADRKIIIQLPPDAPVGAKLAVKFESQANPPKRPRTSLADWTEKNAEDLGDDVSSGDVEGFTGRRY